MPELTVPQPSIDTVVICIPTFRRPKMLKRLLVAISELESSAAIFIIVADNDEEKHEGFDLCNALAKSFSLPLRAVIVSERGIAQARNALVREALTVKNAQFVAMLDDDEWPDSDWLNELRKIQSQTGADVVQGSVIFTSQSGASSAVPDIRGKTGIVAIPHGGGNLLMRMECLRGMSAPWFDPFFGLTGGEDAEFFLRLKKTGAIFAWADEARVYSNVPESREKFSWVLMRAFSHGNSGMLILIKHQPGLSTRVIEAGKIVLIFSIFIPLAIVLFISPWRRFPLLKIARAMGKLGALFGFKYKEYLTIHGE